MGLKAGGGVGSKRPDQQKEEVVGLQATVLHGGGDETRDMSSKT